MDLLLIVIGGIALAAWLYLTKPGRAELATLKTRLAALESLVNNTTAQQTQAPPTVTPAPPPTSKPPA